jgi:hypothetical protein
LVSNLPYTNYILGIEALAALVPGLPAMGRVPNPAASEWIAVIGHNLMGLEPPPIVPNLTQFAVDRLGI